MLRVGRERILRVSMLRLAKEQQLRDDALVYRCVRGHMHGHARGSGRHTHVHFV